MLLLSLQLDLLLGSAIHLKNQTSFRPNREIQKLRRVEAYLSKINKPSIKTIHSPDGDVIECVPSHLQPAFDHPQLQGQKPLVMNLLFNFTSFVSFRYKKEVILLI
jgi:hypothetical protein